MALHGKLALPRREYEDAIAAALPSLAGATLRVLNNGWDSVAVEADGTWIFKFPRDAEAAARLRRECGVLALLRPGSPVPLPDMVLHEGPPIFSQHRKLAGDYVETPDYERLPPARRDTLAAALARFYAHLHAVPLDAARAAGAVPVDGWLGPDETEALAAPVLPSHLRPFLADTMAAYRGLPVLEDRTTFGHFDGHGWNMAYDHQRGSLNGIFDFGDSGFGPLHQDLSYTNWISPDLTFRIIAHYERLTKQPVDRDRVMLYSSILRLVELAGAVRDGTGLPLRLERVEDWHHSLNAAAGRWR